MLNIAAVFKAEIMRLARPEVRDNSDGQKKTVAAQRAEITNLKKRILTLEAMVKQLAKSAGAVPVRPRAPEATEADLPGFFVPIVPRESAPRLRGDHEKRSIHRRADGRDPARG